MNVLITGTNGFIGSRLKKHFDDPLEITENFLHEARWPYYLEDDLNECNPDAIFHVGACSNTLETDVNYIMNLNFEFTKILTDWSKINKKPLIYSSSAACYGTNGRFPSNLYGWSKYTAEQYVISNNGIALRYFNVYGPGEGRKRNMASVAYQSYAKHKLGSDCKLFPKNPTRDFVYVKDIVSANLFALENYDKLNRKAYDVGFGESRSFEDVMNIMEIPFTYHEESSIPEGYQFYTCSDKSKWMPGWKPKYNLEEGLKDYFHV
jgi:ADP-L-glycero-D-manno-heptose 6-epimerase